MLKKFIEKAKEAYKKSLAGIEVDTEQFNDKIAQQVSWKPLVKGGANFRTYQLKQLNNKRIEVIPSIASQIFTHIFLVVGAGCIAVWLYSFYDKTLALDQGMYILPIVGGAFCVASILMAKNTTRTKYFDKSLGYFWIGKKGPREQFNLSENPDFLLLNKIYAIQIIKEKVRNDKQNFISYELNLVCKDLSRLNVMDHAIIDQMRIEAKTLSEFLDVPLWDGSL